MRRRLASALLTAVALVSLTGCIKLDADLTVHEDETVSGTMTVGMSKQTIKLMEGMAESFGSEDGEELGGLDEDFFEEGDVPEGAEVEPYEDDKFIGQTMTFSDVTLDELMSSTSGDEPTDTETWTLVREGDTFVFEAKADLGDEEEASQAEEMGFEGLFEDSEMEISVTFPGRVTEANGEIDGNTVTWRPEFGEPLDMRAEAEATASFPVWPVVGGLVGVLLLGGLVLVAVRQRRSRTRAAAGDGPHGEADDRQAEPVGQPPLS